MKKKPIFFGILTVLVLSLYIMVPATAQTSVGGWKTAPFADLPNDVYQYLPGQLPWEGVKVGSQTGIDIVLVDVQGTEFIIQCRSPPQTGANYYYAWEIDNDADDVAEYVVYWHAGTGFVLKRYSDGQYWNGGGWQVGTNSFSVNVADNNLSTTISGDPIPNLASARLAVNATYTGDPTHVFTDLAPNPPDEAGWILFLIILFPLIGVGLAIFVLYKRRAELFD